MCLLLVLCDATLPNTLVCTTNHAATPHPTAHPHTLQHPHTQVLDADDADVLLGQLTPHLQREQSWSPAQLAAAVVGSLPCLGDVPPRDGQALALLFAAVGAAAAGMEPPDAARTLMVLAQLPGYAPDAQVCCLQWA